MNTGWPKKVSGLLFWAILYSRMSYLEEKLIRHSVNCTVLLVPLSAYRSHIVCVSQVNKELDIAAAAATNTVNVRLFASSAARY